MSLFYGRREFSAAAYTGSGGDDRLRNRMLSWTLNFHAGFRSKIGPAAINRIFVKDDSRATVLQHFDLDQCRVVAKNNKIH